ncbi:MAG: metal-sulfur cluster assembly factor [Alphaproteobacteria bacterium]
MTEQRVLEALRTVMDPEMGINIVDLGLVYGVDAAGGGIRIDLTMTTAACPLGSFLAESAAAAVRDACPGVESVTVDLVWDPPWTPERMSDAARHQLGWSDER